uniref:Uncharacterized protein n=1 Tax=Macaca fascicularis TaxID=9541 RepID=Q8HXK2_MACFA|nr:hypothetical protein [Macaca fascicularis]
MPTRPHLIWSLPTFRTSCRMYCESLQHYTLTRSLPHGLCTGPPLPHIYMARSLASFHSLIRCHQLIPFSIQMSPTQTSLKKKKRFCFCF